MIRVMVVEDEAPILRSIKNAIEMTHDQFQVVATAFNGKEAISLLENTIIDVIFTDIHMPVLDGISLIGHIKQYYPNIVPIIVSGYQDFEYARKAMSLGIVDYLLKPLSPKELKQLLEKIEGQLKKKNEISMGKYISALLQNEELDKSWSSFSKEQGKYAMLLLCAGAFPTFSMEDYSPIADTWNRIDLVGICNGFANDKQKFWVVDGKTVSEKIVLICTPEVDNVLQIEHLALRLSNQLVAVFSVPLTVVIASGIETIEDISIKAQMMRAILYKKVCIGLSQIVSFTQELTPKEAISKLEDLTERKLMLAFEQNNYEMFEVELHKLTEQWKISMPRQYNVEKILKQMMNICLKEIENQSSYFSHFFELDVNQAVLYSSLYDQLFKYLSRIYQMVFSMKKQNKYEMEHSILLMEKVDEYLKSNLAESINHQTLSDKFGLVPSYLSKLFTNYKGMSPSKYLTMLRIQRAKEMILAEPDLLVKDIAALVGYADALHFSKTFKKETGLWPSDYISKIHQ